MPYVLQTEKTELGFALREKDNFFVSILYNTIFRISRSKDRSKHYSNVGNKHARRF